MAHEFSLAYLTVPGLTPPELTRVAAQAGYDFVSHRLVHLGVAGEPEIDPLSAEVIRDTRLALADSGIRVFDIELVRIMRSIEPRSFLPAFEVGAELGASQVICSAWTDVRNDRDFIVDRFCEICELAAPLKLTVNLEFPAFSRLSTLEECLEILELADQPNQGLLTDALYMHFNKMSLLALERVPSEWIHFMHINDAEDISYTKEEMIHTARDERLYPGEGAIDFSAINYLFPELPLAIELPHEKRMRELGPLQHARNCLQAAHKVLNPDIDFD
ncbi:MAG: sugar phosphate isomerase/epimerase [Gammaproteobacteria bacterium]|nr:sugar phosphate isomerase/epimerase [Gammaproteobacteria bacterium]